MTDYALDILNRHLISKEADLVMAKHTLNSFTKFGCPEQIFEAEKMLRSQSSKVDSVKRAIRILENKL